MKTVCSTGLKFRFRTCITFSVNQAMAPQTDMEAMTAGTASLRSYTMGRQRKPNPRQPDANAARVMTSETQIDTIAPTLLATMLPGDYNNNGVVDAADYALWRANQGTNHALPNDAIGGTIGQGEWRIFQDFVKNPKNVDGAAAALEKSAAAAYKK